MAYVKLPEEIRRVKVPRPEGPPAVLVFSVFAGEVSMMTGPAGSDSLETDLRADPGLRESGLRDRDDPPPKQRGKAPKKPRRDRESHRLWIRSRRSEQGFEFHSLPIAFHPGDVAAVAAVMPPKRRDGPIVAAANVDRNEKVDFVGREAQLLKYLSGYARDYRRRRAWLAAWSRAIALGLLAGATGVVAALALWPATSAVPLSTAQAFLDAVNAGAPGALGPTAVGAAAALVVTLHGLIKATMKVSRRARFQRRLLATVWGGAADALGFVQEHANAFRLRQPEALPPSPASRTRRRPTQQQPYPQPQPAWRAGGVGRSQAQVPAFLAERD